MSTTTLRSVSDWSGTFLSLKPIIRAIVLSIVGTWFVVVHSSNPESNVEAIYAGIFDLVSIFTGFLATFYVFVATRSNRFLRKIQHTATFDKMLHLLRFTILWSFWMIAFSYLLMVISYKDIQIPSFALFVVYFWVFNFALIVTNFFRCVFQFVTITSLDVTDTDSHQ